MFLYPHLYQNASKYFLHKILAQTQIAWESIYHFCKASSRGEYGHDPFFQIRFSVFKQFYSFFWRASTWFHNNRYYNGTIYIIDNVIVLSDLVESSGYSSKTLQKVPCPYAPLDEVLRYNPRASRALKRVLNPDHKGLNILHSWCAFCAPPPYKNPGSTPVYYT